MAHRFYSEEAPAPSGLCFLSEADAHHAQRVLRLRSGDSVELIADGRRWSARLQEHDGRLAAMPEQELPSTEPRLQLTLFQGLPKADKMEWIIQKAVELGVVRIVPVRMSRCVVQLGPKDIPRKLERWQRIAREAGKQSGRCVIPEIAPPADLKELPSLTSRLGGCVVPWEECGGIGPRAYAGAHPDPGSLGIVIGPEGGIAPEEMALLRPACEPITLGRRILRTETAGLAAASAFLALYGEMELF